MSLYQVLVMLGEHIQFHCVQQISNGGYVHEKEVKIGSSAYVYTVLFSHRELELSHVPECRGVT